MIRCRIVQKEVKHLTKDNLISLDPTIKGDIDSHRLTIECILDEPFEYGGERRWDGHAYATLTYLRNWNQGKDTCFLEDYNTTPERRGIGTEALPIVIDYMINVMKCPMIEGMAIPSATGFWEKVGAPMGRETGLGRRVKIPLEAQD